jgi:hypothetical protein
MFANSSHTKKIIKFFVLLHTHFNILPLSHGTLFPANLRAAYLFPLNSFAFEDFYQNAKQFLGISLPKCKTFV